MVQFSIVHGNVLVQDIDRSYNQMARSGMALDDKGNYLIATTGTSEATIYANENTFELKSSSFYRIRGNRTWWDRHHLLPASAICDKEFGCCSLLPFTWQ